MMDSACLSPSSDGLYISCKCHHLVWFDVMHVDDRVVTVGYRSKNLRSDFSCANRTSHSDH